MIVVAGLVVLVVGALRSRNRSADDGIQPMESEVLLGSEWNVGGNGGGDN